MTIGGLQESGYGAYYASSFWDGAWRSQQLINGYRVRGFGASGHSIFFMSNRRAMMAAGSIHYYNVSVTNKYQFNWAARGFSRTGALGAARVRDEKEEQD